MEESEFGVQARAGRRVKARVRKHRGPMVTWMQKVADKSCISSPKLFESPSNSSSEMDAATSVEFAGHHVPSGELEFFFPSSDDMARVVGVGLDHAKVKVNRKLEVVVVGVEEKEWHSVWQSKQVSDRQRMGVAQFYFGEVDVSCQVGGNEVHSEDATQFVPFTYVLVKHLLKEMGRQLSGGDHCTTSETQGDLAPHDDARIEEGKEGVLDLRALCKALGDDRLFAADDGQGKPYEEPSKKELKENMLKVTVCPNPGGVFYLKRERALQPPNQELKEVSISPKLIFHFVKKGEFDKKLNIGLKPMFNLDGIEPDDGEGSFGWYQDRIQISMSCAQAFLTKPPCFDEKEKIQLVELSSSSTNSDSIAMNVSTRLDIGLPGLVNLQPQIRGEGSHEQLHSSQQRTSITTTEILGGFHTINRSDGGKLNMYLIFAHKLTPSMWSSSEVRQGFAQSGICQNLRPKIKSTWRPKDNANCAPYFFGASRELNKYHRNVDPFGAKYNKETFSQHFNTQMLVNHNMSHLNTNVIPNFVGLKEGERVNNVIEVSELTTF